MKAGFYKENVIVLRKQVVEGDYTDKEEWVDVYHTKASVKYVSGDRRLDNTEVFYSEHYDFTLRAYVDIQDEDRIRWQGKDYRILNIFRNTDSTYNQIDVKCELINK